MRRVTRALLVLCLLLAQGLWIDHDYHQHDEDHDGACEICLLGHAQDKGVVSLSPFLSLDRDYYSVPSKSVSTFIEASRCHYSSRAPPISI
ncbi:MAG: hypothetical protein AB2598_02125 [Candidatus Thiodiazotropha sp.]